jgi:hypothetical protein
MKWRHDVVACIVAEPTIMKAEPQDVDPVAFQRVLAKICGELETSYRNPAPSEWAANFADFVGRLDNVAAEEKSIGAQIPKPIIEIIRPFGIELDGNYSGSMDIAKFNCENLLANLKFCVSTEQTSEPMDDSEKCPLLLLVRTIKAGEMDKVVTELANHFNVFPDKLKEYLSYRGWSENKFLGTPPSLMSLDSWFQSHWSAQATQIGLDALIEERTQSREPQPMAHMHNLQTIQSLRIRMLNLYSCSVEHDFKTEKTLFKADKSLITKMKVVLEKGIADVKGRLKNLDKDRTALKNKSLGITPPGKKVKVDGKKPETKGSAKKDGDSWALFTFDDGSIVPVMAFDSEVDFKAALADGSFDSSVGMPYVIVNFGAATEFVADRSVKTSLGVFKVNFNTEEGATGRATKIWTHDRRVKLREIMLGLAPQTIVNFPIEPKTAQSVMTQQVQMYLCALDICNKKHNPYVYIYIYINIYNMNGGLYNHQGGL